MIPTTMHIHPPWCVDHQLHAQPYGSIENALEQGCAVLAAALEDEGTPLLKALALGSLAASGSSDMADYPCIEEGDGEDDTWLYISPPNDSSDASYAYQCWWVHGLWCFEF